MQHELGHVYPMYFDRFESGLWPPHWQTRIARSEVNPVKRLEWSYVRKLLRSFSSHSRGKPFIWTKWRRRLQLFLRWPIAIWICRSPPPPSPASKEITSSRAPIHMTWTLDPAILLREQPCSMASAADALGRQKSSWAFGPPRLRRPSR